MPIIYTLLSVIGVSLVSFVGVFAIGIKPEVLKKITLPLVSLSAGTMLGGALLHLLPEALESSTFPYQVFIYFLVGIIIFFALEKIICWRHCHIPTSHNHPHHLGIMNLIGDALHNFIDGVIIAGSFLVNPQLGLVTVISVVIHEIPQEIGDFGVLIYAGFNRAKALLLNFASGLVAVLGALSLIILDLKFEAYAPEIILPITAGGFIYIATADLIPELKKESGIKNSLIQLSFILIGIAIMAILKTISF